MERECQKRYGWKYVFKVKKLTIRCTRVMAVILVAVLLLQCVPSVFMGKCGEDFSRKASAQNTEILSDEYSIEIYDGASGEITADLVMPDLVFKPEEDGAWALDMRMETDSRVTVYFDAIIYEWQYGNCWERIDYSDGSGVAYLDDGTDLYRVFYPSYYQKGHTYKIRFMPIADEQYDLETYHYTFQKTEFAGCQDGLIWRTYNNWVGYGDNDGNAENIRCVGYIGNETILRVPDQIEGHLIDTIGSAGGFHSISNEYLQVLILGEGVGVVESLAECRNLKDIYVYNRDCSLGNNVLPRFYIGSGGSYYGTVIHGYAGGELEKDCLEKDYSFDPLPEPPSPSPQPTETPEPSELPGIVTLEPVSPSPVISEEVSTPHPSASSGGDSTLAGSSPVPSLTAAPSPAASEDDDPQALLPQPTGSDDSDVLPRPTAAGGTVLPPQLTENDDGAALPQPTAADDGIALPQPTATDGGALPAEPENSEMPIVNPTDAPLSETMAPFTAAIENNGDQQTASALPLAKATPLPLLPGLKVSTDHYTKVKLTWSSIPGMSYQVYRSASRAAAYKRIKGNIAKTQYQDVSVKAGKTYYYQVKAVKTEGGKSVIQAESMTVRVKIRSLARPVAQIQKKQDGDIRYLKIQLKKYQGKWVEIYYKDSEWSSYHKIKLYKNRIQKSKQTFRIQCMSAKKSLYLKLRTYTRKNGKKIYSLYTKEKKIKI